MAGQADVPDSCFFSDLRPGSQTMSEVRRMPTTYFQPRPCRSLDLKAAREAEAAPWLIASIPKLDGRWGMVNCVPPSVGVPFGPDMAEDGRSEARSPLDLVEACGLRSEGRLDDAVNPQQCRMFQSSLVSTTPSCSPIPEALACGAKPQPNPYPRQTNQQQRGNQNRRPCPTWSSTPRPRTPRTRPQTRALKPLSSQPSLETAAAIITATPNPNRATNRARPATPLPRSVIERARGRR